MCKYWAFHVGDLWTLYVMAGLWMRVIYGFMDSRVGILHGAIDLVCHDGVLSMGLWMGVVLLTAMLVWCCGLLCRLLVWLARGYQWLIGYW